MAEPPSRPTARKVDQRLQSTDCAVLSCDHRQPVPYYIYGAQQDNSTVGIASASADGALTARWYDVGGGESGYIAPDPNDPQIVYAGSYGVKITRYDHRTGETQAVTPCRSILSAGQLPM